jgi:hypothetical protein
MKKITFVLLFASLVVLIPGCKTTFILTDEIKGIAQNMTPEEAADKLSTIIDKDNTGASIGLESIVTGGLTRVNKDSITYYKTIGPLVDRSASSSFATGYETAATYTERSDVVITVKFNRVKSIKMHKTKDGYLKVTIKESPDFLLTRSMYQFNTQSTNRELAMALCSKLIPGAEIVYSSDADE